MGAGRLLFWSPPRDLNTGPRRGRQVPHLHAITSSVFIYLASCLLSSRQDFMTVLSGKNSASFGSCTIIEFWEIYHNSDFSSFGNDGKLTTIRFFMTISESDSRQAYIQGKRSHLKVKERHSRGDFNDFYPLLYLSLFSYPKFELHWRNIHGKYASNVLVLRFWWRIKCN